MSAQERIAAARALIADLTGHTRGPWFLANSSEVHDRETFFDAAMARVGSTPMLVAEAYSPRERENARLIAAAPAMRGTIAALADLAEAQAQRIAALIVERDAARADERARIISRLEEDADLTPCPEDAAVVRGCARLVRADFSYDEAERLADQATEDAS